MMAEVSDIELVYLQQLKKEYADLMAKQENLYRKMTRQERKEAQRLTKHERELLARLSKAAQYWLSVLCNDRRTSYAVYHLPVAITLPDCCNIDAVFDAADWLKFIGMKMMDESHKQFVVVHVGEPVLQGSCFVK